MGKVHYGWVMVVASFLVLACTAGQMNCYGLLVVPVCEELGIARSAMGVSQSLMNIGSICIPLFAGLIFGRLRLKRLMLVAGITMILGFLSISFAKSIWQIDCAMVVVSLSFALVAWMPFSILMNNWFHEKRGLAMGLAFMGSGLGGMAFATLGGMLIDQHGWRVMVQVFCLIAACINIPVLAFVVREKPEDMGLLPFGMQKGQSVDSEPSIQGGALFSEEMKTPRLWALALCVMAVCFVMNALATSIPAYMEDSGYSSTAAANVSAGYMGALALAKIVLGTAFDKRGARTGTFLSLFSLLCALICLLLVKMPPFIAGVILGGGMGVSFNTIGLPTVARHTYGNRDYSSFTGLLTAANAIGGFIAPTVFGAICDVSGSYFTAYALSIGIVVLFGGVLLRLIPARARA